jgi:hypothetical protein
MLTLEQLTQKHPIWSANADYWREIELLYRGGRVLKNAASQFLVKRPKEPEKVYRARLAQFSYQNVLGTALGWYSTKLFKENIQFFPRRGEQIIKDDGLQKFVLDTDRAGTTLQALGRRLFVRAALDGCAYLLLDLPGQSSATNWKAQVESGELDPLAVLFTATQVTDWDCDAAGTLNWIVISTRGPAPIASPGEKRTDLDRWYVFERETFTIYEADPTAGNNNVRIVNMGRHALADQKRVPVFKLEFPDELQLASRVYLQVISLLNEDNGLAWKLLMSNLAVPVITGDTAEDNNTVSESAWIRLSQGSSFGWSEPTGTSFDYSMRRIQSLIEEIHRQMHLQAQARQNGATPAAQSGLSKEMDMEPANDVLNGYGELFRSFFALVLEGVAAIRSRGSKQAVRVDVQGLTFQSAGVNQIDDATLAKEGVPGSPTFHRWVEKRVVDIFAPNLDPTERKKIHEEIEAAATGQPAPDSPSPLLEQIPAA